MNMEQNICLDILLHKLKLYGISLTEASVAKIIFSDMEKCETTEDINNIQERSQVITKANQDF